LIRRWSKYQRNNFRLYSRSEFFRMLWILI